MSTKRENYILILITATFWGLSFVALNYALKRMDPFQILAARWTIAAAVFGVLVFKGILRIDVHKKSFPYMILTGLASPGLYSIFEIHGLKYTSPSISSIFIATIPTAALVLGLLLFQKKTGPKGILSIILAFSGVMICTVFSPSFSIYGDLRGYAYMLFAVMTGAFYGFFVDRATNEYRPIEVTACMSFMGCVLYNLICFARSQFTGSFLIPIRHFPTLLAILFLGICCSFLCYICFNRLLAVMDVALANNMTSSLVTVIGVAAGIFIAGDPGGLYTVIGLVMTVVGVWLSSQAQEEMDREL